MHQEVATVGLDIAKNVFQVHAIAADGRVLVRRQLRRAEVLKFFSSLPSCLVGLEACASAHHWARELMALGHEVRLMPPAYVKPYVKRGKTDAADAEAIAEAVTRPTMRFVAVKSRDQQAVLMLHKSRNLLVRQRTMLINAVRAHLAEFGVIAPLGQAGVAAALKSLHEEQDRLPELARSALHGLAAQLRALASEIRRIEAQIVAWHKADEQSRRLATIPGVGPITASAIAAAVPDVSHFRSGRQFAAWLGLTPRANSSGGKERLGGITKQGDGHDAGRTQGRRAPEVAGCAYRAQSAESRGGCYGEQDGAHRVGADGEKGRLRSSRRVTKPACPLALSGRLLV